jgi:ArsR family transcriptional regulator
MHLWEYHSAKGYNIGMKQAEQIFKGLADANRLRILNLLMHGELCVCDIQYVLDSPQPNVSRHLTYLKNSGLVVDRREGPRMYYRITQPSDGIHQKLFALLQQVFESEDSFAEDTKKLKKAVENGSCTVSEWRPLSGLVRARKGIQP